MLPKAETACFVIADISGYTGYLAGVELDHAQDILADLIGTVVKVLRPPFRLAKLEGDAAFVYAVTEAIDGTLLQDAVEAAYFAFRRRLRNIRHASACTCNACRNMGGLDLKFVAHYGEFISHSVAGRKELAGGDVIAVHRLLKNAVAETLGGHAYALYSDRCVSAMGIEPAQHGLLEHVETIDILGETKCWLRDLEKAWQTENERKRVEVTRENAQAVFDFDFDTPRPVIWEFFTRPELRRQWQNVDEFVEKTAGGRRGVGTRNHCMHGEAAFLEEVTDWRPFDYLSMRELWPAPGAPWVATTAAFEEREDGGTHLEVRIGKVPAKSRKLFKETLMPLFGTTFGAAIDTLRPMLEAHAETAAQIAEPPMPVSGERFLTEPVKARS